MNNQGAKSALQVDTALYKLTKLYPTKLYPTRRMNQFVFFLNVGVE
jgi:hypothetical protein